MQPQGMGDVTRMNGIIVRIMLSMVLDKKDGRKTNSHVGCWKEGNNVGVRWKEKHRE